MFECCIVGARFYPVDHDLNTNQFLANAIMTTDVKPTAANGEVVPETGFRCVSSDGAAIVIAIFFK